MHCKNVSHQYYGTNQGTKPHILLWICPKIGADQCLSFYISHSFFYLAAFFPLKGKLKYIIIHFQFEISNGIIQSYQFSHWILPLLPLIAPNIDWHYSLVLENSTQSLKLMNPMQKMPINLYWNFGIFFVFKQICK